LTGELAQIEQDIDDGRASAASLVRLFNAATEAEQRRDVDALTRACVLAKQLIEVLGDGVAADAIRLLDHCQDLLSHVHATATTQSGSDAATCPGAGANSKATPSAAAPAANC
jgi:hypothetical protein